MSRSNAHADGSSGDALGAASDDTCRASCSRSISASSRSSPDSCGNPVRRARELLHSRHGNRRHTGIAGKEGDGNRCGRRGFHQRDATNECPTTTYPGSTRPGPRLAVHRNGIHPRDHRWLGREPEPSLDLLAHGCLGFCNVQ